MQKVLVHMLAAAVAVVVVLVRWLGGHGKGQCRRINSHPARTPLDILKERFARGEMDKAEFEDRRPLLGE